MSKIGKTAPTKAAIRFQSTKVLVQSWARVYIFAYYFPRIRPVSQLEESHAFDAHNEGFRSTKLTDQFATCGGILTRGAGSRSEKQWGELQGLSDVEGPD